MKQSVDPKRIEEYLEKGPFDRILSSTDLPFHIFEYEKGEFLCDSVKRTGWLQFMVEGKYNVFYEREDGTYFPGHQTENFGFVGDLEFFGFDMPMCQAASDVVCLSLLLQEVRERLFADVQFLTFLAGNFAWKLADTQTVAAKLVDVETRILQYFNDTQHESEIVSVADLVYYSHCSERHVQRILKTMCENGIIRRVKKGYYKKQMNG